MLALRFYTKCAGVDEFIVSLQKFMETSTLGEYNTRLRIVAAFLEDMSQKGKNGSTKITACNYISLCSICRSLLS